MFTNEHHENYSSDSQRNTDPSKFERNQMVGSPNLVNVPLTMILGGVQPL